MQHQNSSLVSFSLFFQAEGDCPSEFSFIKDGKIFTELCTGVKIKKKEKKREENSQTDTDITLLTSHIKTILKTLHYMAPSPEHWQPVALIGHPTCAMTPHPLDYCVI
jgi:hypothetical protein